MAWSIFLSSILVSLTLLYINTKDTWNWRIVGKILKWFIISLVAIIIFIILALWLGSCISNMPRKMTKLQEVKLGQTKQEVIDSKGRPTHDNYDKLGILTYQIDDNYLNISFSAKEGVVEVSYSPKYEFRTKKEIKEKYGKPKNIIKPKSINGWELPSRWEYPQYNLFFEFFEGDNKLIGYGIYNPKYVPDKTSKSGK